MNGNRAAPFANKQRIKILRLDRRMRAAEVAAEAGISVAQVYRLEAGDRPNVAAVTLARIAQVLDTTMEYLLGLTDDARGIRELTASVLDVQELDNENRPTVV